jgi:hypothetical protein
MLICQEKVGMIVQISGENLHFLATFFFYRKGRRVLSQVGVNVLPLDDEQNLSPIFWEARSPA